MNIAQCTLYCTRQSTRKDHFRRDSVKVQSDTYWSKSYSSDKWIGKSFTRKCLAVQRTFSMPLLHPYTVQYVGIKKTYREKVNIYCLKRSVCRYYTGKV